MTRRRRLPAGSTLWLLGNELRLAWRGLRHGKGGRRRGWTLLGVFAGVTLFAGVPLAIVARHAVVTVDPVSVVVADAVLASMLALMVSASLAAVVEAFYTRGDLDLLLASPIPPRRVLTVRAVAIALEVFAGSAGLLSPLLLPVALIGHPGWLATYPVLLGMALTATAVGLALSLVLLRVLGARRTRTAAQLLAAVIGAALFLGSQIRYLFTDSQVSLVAALVARASRDGAIPTAAVWPLRALLGEAAPAVALIAVGGVMFAAACAWVGRDFAIVAATAAGAGRSPARSARRPPRFSASYFQATLAKELRLLSRDVPLISDVVLKLLYIAPLVFIAIRGASSHAAWSLPSIVSAITFMSGQVAGSLAWITLSAEDAPDLICASPIAFTRLRRAKRAAALLPLAIALAVPLAVLMALSLVAGLAATAGCAAAAMAGALINDWRQSPAKRSDFRRRRSGAVMLGLAEALVGMLIAATAGLAAWPSVVAVFPAVLAVLALLALYRSPAAVERTASAA